MLYYKRKVILPGGRDRRSNTSNKPGDRADANLGSRIKQFQAFLLQKLYYRILLKYLIELGLVNFPEKKTTQNLFSTWKTT